MNLISDLALSGRGSEIFKNLATATASKLKLQAKIISKMLPSIFQIATNPQGCWTLEHMFYECHLEQKKRICNQLLVYYDRLITNRFGLILVDKVHLDKFKQGEHSWIAVMGKKRRNIEQEMKDLFEERELVGHRKRRSGGNRSQKKPRRGGVV
ncbi:hypothetical protein GEMRC1_008742 [Eukaryota sp. GEM-RC1]